MTIRRLGSKTQTSYIRTGKNLAASVGYSSARATADDIRRYHLHFASKPGRPQRE